MKSLVANTLLLLFGIAVSLVFCEIAVRYISTAQVKKEWSDRPSFYYIHEHSETMRDLPYLAAKPADVFRIAVIGDSFSFAPYMQVDDTFAKKLERMLNLNSTNRRVEVINYGVPRYSTSHEVALVERAIREKADLLLLQVTLNDPEIKPYRPTALDGTVVDRFGGIEYTSGILAYWKTAAFVSKRLYNTQSQQKYIDYFRDLFQNKRTWDNFTKPVLRIKELAEESQTPLVAFVFPLFGLPLDDSYPFLDIHQQIGQFFEEQKIISKDLYNLYQGIPIDRLQVIVRKDFHPNEIGHRMAAEAMYSFMVEKNLIPDEFIIKRVQKERIGITIEN